MRAVSATELLDVWERAGCWPLPRRALALLAAALPELDAGELALLSIGRRDDLLLELRELLFGSDMTVVSACPACAVALESTLAVADLRGGGPVPAEAQTLLVDERRITLRAPTAGDLVDLPVEPVAAQRALIARCVTEARSSTDAPSFSEHAIDTIAQAMAAADPLAERELAFDCPACTNRWQAAFDVVRVLWREIDAWAQRILLDVHALARSYGWREADVLALSPTRRALYLEMCR